VYLFTNNRVGNRVGGQQELSEKDKRRLDVLSFATKVVCPECPEGPNSLPITMGSAQRHYHKLHALLPVNALKGKLCDLRPDQLRLRRLFQEYNALRTKRARLRRMAKEANQAASAAAGAGAPPNDLNAGDYDDHGHAGGRNFAATGNHSTRQNDGDRNAQTVYLLILGIVFVTLAG
jgi:hypothetical protein